MTRKTLGYVILFWVFVIGLVPLLTLFPGKVEAQVAIGSVMPLSGDAFAFESVTVSTTAVGLTQATWAPANVQSARAAIITVDTADIRYRYDGGAPTSSVGHAYVTSNTLPLVVVGTNNIRQFRAIREDGSDATLRVTYVR